jgi:predicted 3-demethylubiquinone-9 3-methyltransferase (glyoxalase superfamily)
MKLQKVTPFLWFEKGADEAGKYYASIFKNTRVVASNPMVVTLDLEGMTVLILNGGPTYKLNEAFSLSISCDTQEEIDYFWEKLSAGGSEGRCGWLKDKYGVSWQVVPSILPSLMNNPAKAQKVMAAFMKMNKFDIEALKKAGE